MPQLGTLLPPRPASRRVRATQWRRSKRWVGLGIGLVVFLFVLDRLAPPRLVVWHSGDLPRTIGASSGCWSKALIGGYYCWLGPPPNQQAALPVLDARRQNRLTILVVRFFPLPARTIAVTFIPVGDQSNALPTNQAAGFLLRPGTPSHPGRYRVSVAARWPGRGEIGSDFFLNVK